MLKTQVFDPKTYYFSKKLNNPFSRSKIAFFLENNVDCLSTAMRGKSRNCRNTNMQKEKGDHVNVIRTANGAARCVRRAAPERGGRADARADAGRGLPARRQGLRGGGRGLRGRRRLAGLPRGRQPAKTGPTG